ncbi:DUF3309 family protein [Aromatoleum aromaticum]|uniref:Transmembrane protein n=1 Tax=Aromatoleum aromaticum (strain DSM 19018 / LMG 30748 / EbN1) TaxID=76114 RepID=Q5NXX0_AROAE|nr:hypothetical protein ebA6969 [Aromatoleum aromaticum EbN1]
MIATDVVTLTCADAPRRPDVAASIAVRRARKLHVLITAASAACLQRTTIMALSTILLILLVLLLVGALPTWGYSSSWGYGPSGLLGFLLVVLLVLVLLGVL